LVAEEQSKDVGILNIDVIDQKSTTSAVEPDSNLDAIQHCINAAQTQGKSVWISYLQVLRGNTASRIRIEGARTWYNIVYYKV
jgi:hypothetical protein